MSMIATLRSGERVIVKGHGTTGMRMSAIVDTRPHESIFVRCGRWRRYLDQGLHNPSVLTAHGEARLP